MVVWKIKLWISFIFSSALAVNLFWEWEFTKFCNIFTFSSSSCWFSTFNKTLLYSSLIGLDSLMRKNMIVPREIIMTVARTETVMGKRFSFSFFAASIRSLSSGWIFSAPEESICASWVVVGSPFSLIVSPSFNMSIMGRLISFFFLLLAFSRFITVSSQLIIRNAASLFLNWPVSAETRAPFSKCRYPTSLSVCIFKVHVVFSISAIWRKEARLIPWTWLFIEESSSLNILSFRTFIFASFSILLYSCFDILWLQKPRCTVIFFSFLCHGHNAP